MCKCVKRSDKGLLYQQVSGVKVTHLLMFMLFLKLFRVCVGKMEMYECQCVCLKKRIKKQIPTVTLTGNYEFVSVRLRTGSQLHISPQTGQSLSLPSSLCADVGTGQSSPKPASEETLIFELFTLTPLQCGLAESGSDYQTEEIQRLDCQYYRNTSLYHCGKHDFHPSIHPLSTTAFPLALRLERY